MRRPVLPLCLIPLILGLGGCATPIVEQERSGFISDYSSLVKTSKNTLETSAPSLASYTSFLVERPVLLLTDDGTGASEDFTDEELNELVTYAEERITDRLMRSGRYVVVTQQGEGVARIRLGITAVDPSVGALNVLLYTRITGAGLGGAAFESEITDSLTNEQLAATIQWGSGSRVLRAGLTRLGDAKLQINRLVRNLVQQLDREHDNLASTKE